MTPLLPSLAIVTLLLCFCGTLAAPDEEESHDVVVVKEETQTQLPSATAEDLLKEVEWRQVGNVALKGKDQPIDALNKKKTREELKIELETLIPKLESSILTAKKLLLSSLYIPVDELAANITHIKVELRPAVGCDDHTVVGVKNAKDNLQGNVKEPSSIKVVQAVTSHPITDKQKPGFPKGKTQTQLPSATAEDLMKTLTFGNVALKRKDQLIDALNKKNTKEELEIELKTLIPKLESSIHNAKDLLVDTPSMSAEELATNLKPIKDTLRPAVGGDNQIVAGVKKAKVYSLGIVKDPSSIKDYKVVQAVTSQPIIDEVIHLLVNTPSMSIEELAKNLKTIKDTLRPAVGGDNQIVAGVKQAKDNLQGIVKDPSSINDYEVVQEVPIHPIADDVVNHPMTQKITETAFPWLERWIKRGPAKVVM